MYWEIDRVISLDHGRTHPGKREGMKMRQEEKKVSRKKQDLYTVQLPSEGDHRNKIERN